MHHFLTFIHTHADFVNFARICLIFTLLATCYGWFLGLWLTRGANPKPILYRLSRLANRVYARLLGYFWMRCPQCGDSFGGHEIVNHPLACKDYGLVCPDCAERNIAAAMGVFAPLLEERV